MDFIFSDTGLLTIFIHKMQACECSLTFILDIFIRLNLRYARRFYMCFEISACVE